MPVQVWIQTQKEYVQKIKLILKEAGQLNRSQKVRAGPQNDYMILPTNTYRDEEVNDESGYLQILSDLHLCGASICLAAEIVYLPPPPPRPEVSELRRGPVQEAILEWLRTLPELSPWRSGATSSDLVKFSPRHWSIYEPMLLLPSGSLQHAIWTSLRQSIDRLHLDTLWEMILHAVSMKEGRKQLSHLAVNSGIPLGQESPTAAERENIFRNPSGLALLFGDFGTAIDSGAGNGPTEQDFQDALWVSTKQNGIHQTWAPRYTMFSRGNITEKARILSFHSPKTAMVSTRKEVSREELARSTAVDLYAGIGYFAFSYAEMGLEKVLCWEINPWSVEGFRRGCQKNGWTCRVLRGKELES